MPEADITAVKTELDLILSSKLFQKSPVLSNFLRFVVTETLDNKVDEIKEYSIAVKALGKPPDFNPQLDALIRIHAGRLRRNLLEYYHDEGINDPLVISLKKGSYIPEFLLPDSKPELQTSLPESLKQADLPINRVAVLPFKNLSGLAENDFMIDGFGEQLSSDLAQFREIAVIAYFSTSKFRNEKVDIRDVGKELNTSHLITGSIYRDKEHIRVSMQLVNSLTGAQLWTQTYDRILGSSYLFDVFDDIIKQVVPKLTGYYGLINRNTAIASQLDPSLDQNTVDAVFWYYHYQIRNTEELFQVARQRLEKAVQKDPDYALAWAILAQLYIDSGAYFYKSVGDPLKEANRCIHNALRLDPDCQHAYISRSWMFVFLRERENAIEAVEHAVLINPRSAFFLGAASFLLGIVGEYEKSMEYFRQSNILNPYYSWWINLGPVFTYFYEENYEEALKYANRINIPEVFWNMIFKIAALGQLSRIDEAAKLAVKYEIRFPGMAAKACLVMQSILYHEVILERIKKGLQIAGLKTEA